MIILAYGVKQPTTGDKGSVFFPALEELCQRMASHDHDGLDSKPVSAASVEGSSVLAPAAGFSFVSAGIYSQLVNLPSGFNCDDSLLQVKLESTKEIVYPSIERMSATQIKIFSAVNNLDYRVYVK